MIKKRNLEYMGTSSKEYDNLLLRSVEEINEYETYCGFYHFYAQLAQRQKKTGSSSVNVPR